ncbi:MAG: HGGxSTG domain-containing protein [Agrobacterium albertimagni]
MPRKRSDRQKAWDKFGLPKAGAAALTRYNREIRPFRKLCGARTKSTEDHRPCQNLALAGHDRCRIHGGATPKADQWGLVQWPNGKAADAEAKLQAKLKRIERTRKEKAKRLAAMSPEERQRFEARAKTHAPGPAAERARRRDDRKRAAEIRASLEKPDYRPVSAELAELQRQAAALEKARDHFRRLAEQQTQPTTGAFD